MGELREGWGQKFNENLVRKILTMHGMGVLI